MVGGEVQWRGCVGAKKRSKNGRFNELGEVDKGPEEENVCVVGERRRARCKVRQRMRIGGGIQKKIGVRDGLAPSRERGGGGRGVTEASWLGQGPPWRPQQASRDE